LRHDHVIPGGANFPHPLFNPRSFEVEAEMQRSLHYNFPRFDNAGTGRRHWRWIPGINLEANAPISIRGDIPQPGVLVRILPAPKMGERKLSQTVSTKLALDAIL